MLWTLRAPFCRYRQRTVSSAAFSGAIPGHSFVKLIFQRALGKGFVERERVGACAAADASDPAPDSPLAVCPRVVSRGSHGMGEEETRTDTFETRRLGTDGV